MLRNALTRTPSTLPVTTDPFAGFAGPGVFDDFWGAPTRLLSDWLASRGQTAASWYPPVEIRDTGDAYVMQADLPGLKKKDVHLSLESNVLTFSGERSIDRAESDSQYRNERWFGRFSRSFSLPSHVQTDGADATFEDGVLTVRIPKAREAQRRQIAVN